MTAADVLVVAMAAARLTRLVRSDRFMDGPRDALTAWAMNRAGPDRDSLLVYLLGCVWCIAVWAAAVSVAVWLVAPLAVYVAAVAWIAARLEQ